MFFSLLRLGLRVALVYGVWRFFLHQFPLTDAMGHLLWGHAFAGFLLGLVTVFALMWDWFRS